MNIHEYQAKALLRSYRITTPRGEVVYTAKAAARVAEDLGGSRWVVKAQIHAGGRGKAGGVKIADTPEGTAELADQMLGSTLVTPQTGPAGSTSAGCWSNAPRGSSASSTSRCSSTATRSGSSSSRAPKAASTSRTSRLANPDAIHTEYVDPGVGLLDFQCRKVADAIGLGNRTTSFTRLLKRIYRLFRDTDCLLLEINPFIEAEDGELVALDCKMSFDDNALFRQGDIVELRDFDEEDPKEVEASGHGLNYIALDGTVGCIVNGAGLAMGDDGRDRAPRRTAGELPRRGGRRQPREDRERVPHRAEGPERARDPGEHLRGDQPVRLDRPGRGAGDARPGDRRPRDRAPGRDQRGGGPRDPGRERPGPDPGRGPRRRGAQGRGGRGRQQEVPA